MLDRSNLVVFYGETRIVKDGFKKIKRNIVFVTI